MRDTEDRLVVDEILVRGFTMLGVLIWAVAAFGALAAGSMQVFYGYGVVALFVSTAFIIGLYFERIAAVELTVGAAGLVAWGVTAGWDVAMWVMIGAMMIVPMAVAAGMYFFAAHEEEVIEHAEQLLPARPAHA